MLVSRPIQLTLEEGLPVADTREHRIQSRRSGILALNRLGLWFLVAARAVEGLFGVGLRKQGSAAHGKVKQLSEGGVRKGLKRKKVEQQGARTFIDVESGGWPVHAPCPMQRAPNPGGQTPDLRLLFFLFLFSFLLIY